MNIIVTLLNNTSHYSVGRYDIETKTIVSNLVCARFFRIKFNSAWLFFFPFNPKFYIVHWPSTVISLWTVIRIDGQLTVILHTFYTHTYLHNIKSTRRRHHNTYLQQRRDDLDELPGRLYFIHRSLATAAAGKKRTHNPEKTIYSTLIFYYYILDVFFFIIIIIIILLLIPIQLREV